MSELETANSALSNHVEELTTKCGSLMDITYELGYQNSLLREKVLQLTSQLAKKDDQLVDQGEELEGRRTEVDRLQGIVVELEGKVSGGEWRGGHVGLLLLCEHHITCCPSAASRQAAPKRDGVLEGEGPRCVDSSGTQGEGDQGAAGQGSPPREGGSRGNGKGGCVRRPDEP